MMIELLALLQLSATVPAAVTVHDGDRVTRVPVVRLAQGPAVSADLVARSLGGTVRARGRDAFTVAIGETRLEFTAHVPFARVKTEAVTLPADPVVRGGALYVPLATVTDLLPRIVAGLTYDRRQAVLRRPPAPEVAETGDSRRAAREQARAVPRAPERQASRARRRIVIDAGHGGPDNGMRGPIGGGPPIREKDITLAVSRELRAILLERDVDVVMTRTTDTLIALSDRGRIANERKGDVFLSIHVNAANPRWKQPGAARGVETYFLSEAKTEDARRVEQMENEVVKYEIAKDIESADPLSFIVHDMEQNQHLRESSELADRVQRALARTHPGPNRGVKQAGFRVLVTAFMPAVLIEIGFGTNPQEARYLSDVRRQREIATAIADATIEYLAAYERRTSAGGQ